MIHRLANVCCYVYLLLLLIPVTAMSSPPPNPPASPETLLQHIERQQSKLRSLRETLTAELSEAQEQSLSRETEWLQLERKLMDTFIFSKKKVTPAQDATNRGRELLANEKQAKAMKTLRKAQQHYAQLLEDQQLIAQTVEAEKRAQQTHDDSKMYFMMRVRSDIPPKVLKAYGIMDLARQERNQGKFQQALEMWAQAEKMVKEGFNEHIAQMAEWRENAKREAAIQRKKIKKKVDALLKEHFVPLEGGRFTMGSDTGPADERPAREVTVPPFKIGKTEVTFELYDYCVESSRCYSVPEDEGWGRDDQPVINVSYRDITKQFLPWLNDLTGNTYRLPSEAEWEYAARAGSQKSYTWGDNLTCSMARYDGGGASVCNANLAKNQGPAPVASYKPNAFGLYDVHGNVWEWVEDCWHPSYQNAPTDGSPRTDGNCNTRGLRGGSWDDHKGGARLANRYYAPPKKRQPSFGFRLVLDE